MARLRVSKNHILKKNQVVDHRSPFSCPLFFLHVSFFVPRCTCSKPRHSLFGNYGHFRGRAPPPSTVHSSSYPILILDSLRVSKGDRREHHCHRSLLNPCSFTSLKRQPGSSRRFPKTKPIEKKKKKKKTAGECDTRRSIQIAPVLNLRRATGTEFSSVRNGSSRFVPVYDARFRPVLDEIPSKSAGTLSQIVVVHRLRVLRLQGGHFFNSALLHVLLFHEANAPCLVPHHYVHHERKNQDSACGTWEGFTQRFIN